MKKAIAVLLCMSAFVFSAYAQADIEEMWSSNLYNKLRYKKVVPVINIFPREPVSSGIFLQCDGGACGIELLTVPSGRRLVIETISVKGQSFDPNQHIEVDVDLNAGSGRPSIVFIPLTMTVPNADPSVNFSTLKFVGTHNLRLYADPDTQVNITISLLTNAYTEMFATLSGYLVPLGSPTLSP